MTEKERELCEELRRVGALRYEEAVDRFIEVVRSLSSSTDPEVLRCLLQALYDADAGEAQYELVEAAEGFPDEVYVPMLVEELPGIRERAPRWGRLLLQSVLNSESARQQMEALIPGLDEALKANLLEAVQGIASDDFRYQILASRLGSLAG